MIGLESDALETPCRYKLSWDSDESYQAFLDDIELGKHKSADGGSVTLEIDYNFVLRCFLMEEPVVSHFYSALKESTADEQHAALLLGAIAGPPHNVEPADLSDLVLCFDRICQALASASTIQKATIMLFEGSFPQVILSITKKHVAPQRNGDIL
jgi:hypothetical protein